MIEWNNFYGAILIDREYEVSKDYIRNGLLEKEYLYFHPDIFSTGIQKYPYYYGNILFTFGRTAKYFACNTNELEEFIVEFEDILSNIDFENAQIRINTDYANYDLFWLNKLKLTESKKNETIEHFKEFQIKYFESEKFFFGIAEIDLYTGWTEKYNDEKISEFENWYPDFKYPF
ncbi:hypothetical protein [Flavobacterium macrobrachii]|jgi:hypothetical protein|uniref:hypothetical protein n=1 Tax=Flavobacterium macrobrachii TaxID=591204 RepID=UPI0037BEB6E8